MNLTGSSARSNQLDEHYKAVRFGPGPVMRVVLRLYELTEEEIKIVEGWLETQEREGLPQVADANTPRPMDVAGKELL